MKKGMLSVIMCTVIVMIFMGGNVGAESKLPPLLGIATAGVGSGGHSMAVAYAPILQKHLGVQVRVMPAWSVAVNLSQIKDRRAYFVGGGVSQGNAGMAAEAHDIFASHEWGPQRVGIVWYNYTCPYGLMVRGDSDVKKIADLKGKKLAFYGSSPAWTSGLEGGLAFGRLSLNDVEKIEVGGYSQCARAVADGRADFTYNAPISTVTIEVEQNPKGIRYLPMDLNDKEGWDRYFEINPFFANLVCSTGVKSAAGVPMGNHPFVIWTYESVDQDLVYRVAKFFSEQHDQYKDLHANLSDMSFEKMVEFKNNGVAMPILPGSVKYLKEKGVWDEADEKWNNEQREKIDKLEQAWQAALDEAIPKKINPDYRNKAWLEIWEKHRSTLPRFRSRVK